MMTLARKVSGRPLLRWLPTAICLASAWSVASAASSRTATESPGAAAGSSSTPATLTGGAGSLAGVWLVTGYKASRASAAQRVVTTIDGKPAPLLPAAAALLESRIADADRGYPFANTLTSCLPGGMPMMIIAGAPYPIQILETAGQVTMLFEEQNHFRIVHLGGRHPVDPDPTFMGHSIGHWEGDTLVVDTVGLSERTTIDQVGMPHSEKLQLIERYRRVDRDTLEVRVTFTDPDTFSSSWQTAAVYKSASPDVGVSEYICENNRNQPDGQGHMGFQR